MSRKFGLQSARSCNSSSCSRLVALVEMRFLSVFFSPSGWRVLPSLLLCSRNFVSCPRSFPSRSLDYFFFVRRPGEAVAVTSFVRPPCVWPADITGRKIRGSALRRASTLTTLRPRANSPTRYRRSPTILLEYPRKNHAITAHRSRLFLASIKESL